VEHTRYKYGKTNGDINLPNGFLLLPLSVSLVQIVGRIIVVGIILILWIVVILLCPTYRQQKAKEKNLSTEHHGGDEGF